MFVVAENTLAMTRFGEERKVFTLTTVSTVIDFVSPSASLSLAGLADAAIAVVDSDGEGDDDEIAIVLCCCRCCWFFSHFSFSFACLFCRCHWLSHTPAERVSELCHGINMTGIKT